MGENFLSWHIASFLCSETFLARKSLLSIAHSCQQICLLHVNGMQKLTYRQPVACVNCQLAATHVWLDDLRFYVLFNSIFTSHVKTIEEQKWNNISYWTPFTVEKVSPRAGFEPWPEFWQRLLVQSGNLCGPFKRSVKCGRCGPESDA